MIISHTHQFIFIKTRKTAGSTFEHLIAPYLDFKKDICTGSLRDDTPKFNDPTNGDGHAKCGYIRSKFPESWNRYYKFAVERNPWDKVVSAFFWHKQTKPHLTERGFDHYVATCPLLPTDWHHYTIDNEIAVDHIYFYEDQMRLYCQMNFMFGTWIDIEQLTNTRKKGGLRKDNHYSEMYSDESRERVAEIFSREIKAFNYEYQDCDS